MANVLGFDKQVVIIGSLAEASSIRSIKRMTAVHRDTIMRLGVKVGQGCVKVQDAWAHDTDDPAAPRRHVTVLHSHPIESARQAVQAAIVQEFGNLESA